MVIDTEAAGLQAEMETASRALSADPTAYGVRCPFLVATQCISVEMEMLGHKRAQDDN